MISTPSSHPWYEANFSVMRISSSNAGSAAGPGVTYGPGALPTPDTDIMSPLSSASSPFDPPSADHPGQDWSAIAAAGYNPYFPLNAGENGMYN
jgi:hypothetical protein